MNRGMPITPIQQSRQARQETDQPHESQLRCQAFRFENHIVSPPSCSSNPHRMSITWASSPVLYMRTPLALSTAHHCKLSPRRMIAGGPTNTFAFRLWNLSWFEGATPLGTCAFSHLHRRAVYPLGDDLKTQNLTCPHHPMWIYTTVDLCFVSPFGIRVRGVRYSCPQQFSRLRRSKRNITRRCQEQGWVRTNGGAWVVHPWFLSQKLVWRDLMKQHGQMGGWIWNCAPEQTDSHAAFIDLC